MVAGLATLQAFEDEDILDRVRRTGKAFTKALQPLVDRYECLHEVRGLGLMIGLVFGEPTTPGLRRRFRMVEALRPALFSQMIVVPLFHRHGVLTQVAADNMNVIKLLPPLIAGDDEVEQFTDALDDVLASAERGSSLIFEFGKTMAKGTLRRARL
jgi:ornithine--oxo-acid transaminase